MTKITKPTRFSFEARNVAPPRGAEHGLDHSRILSAHNLNLLDPALFYPLGTRICCYSLLLRRAACRHFWSSLVSLADWREDEKRSKLKLSYQTVDFYVKRKHVIGDSWCCSEGTMLSETFHGDSMKPEEAAPVTPTTLRTTDHVPVDSWK